MALRHCVARTLVGLAIFMTALVAVGVTASPESVFSIAVHPVFLRVDAASIAQARARALGLDIDITLGPMHLHLGWSAVPLTSASTNSVSMVF